ncbi:MAG: hypothetical protein ABH883_01510 [Candidatus Omnitrophota bacterium]
MLMNRLSEPGTIKNRQTIKRNETIKPVLKNLLLCRGVQTEPAGENTYQGEFKNFIVDEIPAVKTEMFVVTKWGDGQGAQFQQVVRIVDPENSLEIFNSFELENRFLLENIYHEHIVVGRITDLFLPREGRYRVEVYLGSEIAGRTYFRVGLKKNVATDPAFSI